MEGGGHSDLTGIAIVAVAAMLCGLGLERLRQPAVVGYILAGALLGPTAFAVVTDRAAVDMLAELGVLLLLFVVGMELSLRSFRRLWVLAALAMGMQVAVSLGVMLLLSMVFAWPFGVAVLLGFVVALSSTAVAIKILDDVGELRTRVGRITVGVLIAQDFAVVPMMLIVGALAGGGLGAWTLVKIVASVAVLAGLILFLSRGRKVELPFSALVAGNADLESLAGLAFCFAAAAVSGLLGLSAAYGAFLAGLVIGNSNQRHAMMSAIKPIEAILLMVFFVSVGLLIDLGYIWDNLGAVLFVLLVVSVFKTALNVGILRLLGQTWHHAFLASLMLAQIGEFSFLLALIGLKDGLITPAESRLVVAVTALSLAISPLWVVTARRLQALTERGITSGRELTRLVYGREVEVVVDVVDEARGRSLIAARRATSALRAWRSRQKAASVASTTPTTLAAEDEAKGKRRPSGKPRPSGKRRKRKKAGDA
jgi:CPA2 family monovalent cation:H+ antiporter-2